MARLLPAGDRLARGARAAIGLLLPPRCLSCGEPVDEPGALCGGCWPKLTFLGPPMCAACGFPFEFDPGADALCGACIRRPRPYGRGRAVLRYDEASRALIVAFKHGDRTDAAPAYGRWLARAGADLLADADILVPVPLHRTRLIARRYNQSALLVNAVASETGIAARPDALARTRRTPSQGRMNRSERERNVRGAFLVRPNRAGAVRGLRVVLIDDVLTTGATAAACARALRRGGAASVDVLTLARVVRPEA